MKKTLFAAVIALLCFSGSLMSQKQLYFGLGGTGLSSLIINQNNYGEASMDDKATFGGSGNLNVGLDFNNHLGLKLEIGFAKLGENYDDPNGKDTDSTTASYTRKVKLNYLQIPLLFKYRTGGNVAKFYLMVGPQINYLLSASQEYLKNNNTFTDTIPGNFEKPELISEETITNRYNSLDIMGRLDFGVDINLTTNLVINAGLTMAYGLTDINASDFQIPYKGTYNPSHNLYGGVNFGINYKLPLGKK